ncbi:MAG: hypothetical protein H7124_01645 [Phycisphaerales bacterium]|nr:hypothetical protein [Hyphomonadaceae bacterium]
MFALSFAATNPALAQAPQPSRIEEARALIQTNGVGDVFEALEDDSIAVRHTASGLTCHFYGGETRIDLIAFSQVARSDDVGCNSEGENRSQTLYATRYMPPITVDRAMGDAIAGIRNRFSDARPTPALMSMSTEGLSEPLIQHFLVTVRGEQWMTSAYIVQDGEWIIKLRYSQQATNEELMAAQLEAGAIFALAQVEIQN